MMSVQCLMFLHLIYTQIKQKQNSLHILCFLWLLTFLCPVKQQEV